MWLRLLFIIVWQEEAVAPGGGEGPIVLFTALSLAPRITTRKYDESNVH